MANFFRVLLNSGARHICSRRGPGGLAPPDDRSGEF